jgi:hypothetical protein
MAGELGDNIEIWRWRSLVGGAFVEPSVRPAAARLGRSLERRRPSRRKKASVAAAAEIR